ncbi:MAG: hypothetical protein FOGNACKC_01137 [Anaerolineae bacterium]|nr:hypothetical protein [Anaerolineae bacterium]
MQPWTVEYGTLWVFETKDELPPACPARIEAKFEEAGVAAVDELTAAMNLPTPEPVRERFRGNRRCFVLRISGQIASYGWVTHGLECVGELERRFHLHTNEAYIWDCGTVPAWRRQGLYSALLSQLLARLHAEGLARIWIGASRQNQPSIQGFVNAGFKPVVDVTYRRLFRLSLLRIHRPYAARPALVKEAYRILVDDHERRLGQLAVGYQNGKF